jgi:hypothetical protein
MTSTHNDIERDAALGRIFRELLGELAKIEKAWLDNADRADDDLQAAALGCFDAIGLALLKAKQVGQRSIQGYNLPWPLLMVSLGLQDVFKGRYSDILTPISQGRHRPKGAQNRLKAMQVAQARETLAWLERKGWPLSKAVGEIAAIFEDNGIKANGGKPITVKTILGWRKQSNKTAQTEADMILEERSDYRKALDDFDSTDFKVVKTTTSIEAGPSPIYPYARVEVTQSTQSQTVTSYAHWEEDEAAIILAELRRFIAATSYKN